MEPSDRPAGVHLPWALGGDLMADLGLRLELTFPELYVVERDPDEG